MIRIEEMELAAMGPERARAQAEIDRVKLTAAKGWAASRSPREAPQGVLDRHLEASKLEASQHLEVLRRELTARRIQELSKKEASTHESRERSARSTRIRTSQTSEDHTSEPGVGGHRLLRVVREFSYYVPARLALGPIPPVSVAKSLSDGRNAQWLYQIHDYQRQEEDVTPTVSWCFLETLSSFFQATRIAMIYNHL